MVPFERAMVVSYRLSIVTIALSLTIQAQFAVECLRRSSRKEVGHTISQNLGEEGVDRCKPNLAQSGRNMGLPYAKETLSIFSAV